MRMPSSMQFDSASSIGPPMMKNSVLDAFRLQAARQDFRAGQFCHLGVSS